MDISSFFCFWIDLLVGIPQSFLDYWLGLFGLAAPDVLAGVGSIFGCPV